jgi:hypothetical protein
MAFQITDGVIGSQLIADTSTTKKHPLGTIVRAKDSTYGEGEFIYLLGVASTAVGSIVTWNASTFQTTLAAVGANKSFPLAIAMSANVASQYGWYQISGFATAKKTNTVSLAAGAAVGILTTGLIAGTGSGKEVQGALVAAVASAKSDVTTVLLHTSRPRLMGRVT